MEVVLVTATFVPTGQDQARAYPPSGVSAAEMRVRESGPPIVVLPIIQEADAPDYERLVARIIKETGYGRWQVGSFMRWLDRRARSTRHTGVMTHQLPFLQLWLHHPLLDRIMPDDQPAGAGTLHAQLQAYFSHKEGRPITFRHTKIQSDLGWRTVLACALHASSLTTTFVANGIGLPHRSG